MSEKKKKNYPFYYPSQLYIFFFLKSWLLLFSQKMRTGRCGVVVSEANDPRRRRQLMAVGMLTLVRSLHGGGVLFYQYMMLNLF